MYYFISPSKLPHELNRNAAFSPTPPFFSFFPPPPHYYIIIIIIIISIFKIRQYSHNSIRVFLEILAQIVNCIHTWFHKIWFHKTALWNNLIHSKSLNQLNKRGKSRILLRLHKIFRTISFTHLWAGCFAKSFALHTEFILWKLPNITSGAI